MPLVSVVLPVYNAEKYLREAVDSVLSQSLTDFEIVAISDGPSDSSREILASYNDPRLRIIDNDGNKGLVYSLNRGIEESSGVYIARMDSDDVCHPQRLERQVEFLEKNSDVGMIGSYVKMFGDHISAFVHKMPINSDEIKAEYLFSCTHIHPSVMFRKSFFQKNNLKYSKEFTHIEDFDLFQRASAHFKLSNIPEVLLDYRQVKSSISNTMTNEKKELNLENHRRIYKQTFKNLGLPISEGELVVHTNIIFSPRFQNIDDLVLLKEWFEKLWSFNQKVLTFDQDALFRILCVYWTRVFFRSTHLGRAAYLTYNSSQFSRSPFLTMGQKAKFFIKCHLRA